MFIRVKYIRDAVLYVEAKGKLDIYNEQDYFDEIKKHLHYIKELILDFSQIDYVASIGLRGLLELHKIMQEHEDCHIKLKNVKEEVLSVFKITGFDKFLIIENDSEEG